MIGILVFLVIVGSIIFYIISLYNGLVSKRNNYKNAFSQIDVQLKRRYDLIPNLVETVKGYIKHERETLEAVIAARTTAVAASKQAATNPGDPGLMQALGGAEGMLTGALGRLFAVAESYPDLKANQNAAQLQEELASTENRISFARQAYNDMVTTYNTACEQFPTTVIAGMFNFTKAELLASTDTPEERKAPKVSFS